MTTKKKRPEACCSICGNDIDVQFAGTPAAWAGGHNAQPINDGRCCSSCNDTVIIPTRIGIATRQRKTER